MNFLFGSLLCTGLAVAVLAGELPCPISKCACKAVGQRTNVKKAKISLDVDCSNRGLDTLPNGLDESVVSLNFRGNQLTKLTLEHTCDMPNLEYLDLSSNRLEEIAADAFVKSTMLRHLNLRFNRVPFYEKSTSKLNFMKHLSELTWLNIQDNGPSNTSYPADKLQHLNKLKYLALTGLSAEVKPENGLRKLNQIEILEFSSSSCQIGNISWDFFDAFHVTSIRKLSVRNCGLQAISGEAFRNFTSLKTIDLSCNPMLGASLHQINLSNTKVQIAVLDGISSKEYPMYLNKSSINFMRNVNITHVSMENNYIAKIRTVFRNLLPNLEYASIAGTKIVKASFSQGEGIVDIAFHPNIRVVDVSYFSGPTKKPLVCEAPSRLYTLEEKIIHSAMNACKYWNNKDDIEAQHQTENFQSATLPKNIEAIYMHHNPRWHGMIQNLGIFHNHLRIVDASYDDYTAIQGKLFGFECVERLDLSHNLLKRIETTAIRDFPSLKYVSFRNNSIGKVIDGDEKGELFNLNALEYLDLSQNHITDFNSKAFNNLTSMQHLNLSYNEICDFEDDLSVMTQLKVLDLRHNNLTHIPDKQIKDLHNIASKGHGLTVMLAENPWNCTSGADTFHTTPIGKILICTDIQIGDIKDITCVNDTSIEFVVNILFMHKYPSRVFTDCFPIYEEKDNLYFILAMTLLPVVGITLIIFIVFISVQKCKTMKYTKLAIASSAVI